MHNLSHTNPEKQSISPQLSVGHEVLPPESNVWRDEELFIRKTFGQHPKEACGLLFKRYHTALCNHAVRLVYSRQVAEDLVAEVFYQFWKNKVYEHITSSYRAYLFTSVRNRAYNFLQLELSRRASIEDCSPISALCEPDQHLFFTELSQKMEMLVSALPPQSKKVFIMNRFEGRKYREIADVLQISVRTVEVHLRRAIASLRAGLKESGFVCLLVVMLGRI